MILLTGEEISQAKKGHTAIMELRPTVYESDVAIAKAQLKRVTEMKVIDCYGGNKMILAKDWQALLEEIK